MFFVLHLFVDAYYKNKNLYDLVMRIATGAILSEVVLNFQNPGETMLLNGLNFVLDAPLLMSALGLTGKEDNVFASEVCKQLRNKKANLVVFEHSIDELKTT